MVTAFSEGMVDDGYEDVVNVDISSVVIEAMMKKYSNRQQLKCILISYRYGHAMNIFVKKKAFRIEMLSGEITEKHTYYRLLKEAIE